MAVEEWEQDLKNSGSDFENVVAPVLEEWSAGENISVESVTESKMAEKLDTIAGVDSWQVRSGDMIRGVGSRVQYMDNLCFETPPDTFTVRKQRVSGVKTEFQKRLEAIRNDGLYPYWTTQAYLSSHGGELRSLGRVKTKDLIRHIHSGEEGDAYEVIDPPGEASFFSVKWATLEDLGIGVRYKRPYKNKSGSGSNPTQVGLSSFVSGR